MPTFLPVSTGSVPGQLVQVRLGPVRHEALQVADGHRVALLGADADALALRLLRADPPGHAGQGVVVQEALRGGGHVAFAQGLDEPGDVHPDGTAVHAEGLGALDAALGLEHRQLVGEAEVDLFEVVGPDVAGLLRHGDAVDLHPLLVGERGLGCFGAVLAGRHRGRGLGHAFTSVVAQAPFASWSAWRASACCSKLR